MPFLGKYQSPIPIDKPAAEQAFLSGDTSKVCDAMVAVAFYENDWKWAQDKFLGFLEDANSNIRGLAATCLGHIARIHGQIEKEIVITALRSHLQDTDIAGQVEDALEDIGQYT